MMCASFSVVRGALSSREGTWRRNRGVGHKCLSRDFQDKEVAHIPWLCKQWALSNSNTNIMRREFSCLEARHPVLVRRIRHMVTNLELHLGGMKEAFGPCSRAKCHEDKAGIPILFGPPPRESNSQYCWPSVSSHSGICKAITVGLILKYWLKRSTAYLGDTNATWVHLKDGSSDKKRSTACWNWFAFGTVASKYHVQKPHGFRDGLISKRSLFTAALCI